MSTLLVVGGGLFGSQIAAYARRNGLEALVFDPGLEGAASPAAAGLFKEEWAGRKWHDHFRIALPVLDELYGIRHIDLMHDDGVKEQFLFVPPSAILETKPLPHTVTAVGDGWLDAAGQRFEGVVCIAAGVWCKRFVPGLEIQGKSGSSFTFAGTEKLPSDADGRIRPLAWGRQALVFTREAGNTYFTDGTADEHWTTEHDRQILARAATFGLTDPITRFHGQRPYTPGGPILRQISDRTWVATGGRKLGTLFGAAFAHRLVHKLLGNCREDLPTDL